MEDTSKANIVFNISGGNNQILPNAIKAEQNFYGDKYIEQMMKAKTTSQEPVLSPETSRLSLYINNVVALAEYVAKLSACTNAKELAQVVMDMVNDTDVKVDQDIMVKQEFIEVLQPLVLKLLQASVISASISMKPGISGNDHQWSSVRKNTDKRHFYALHNFRIFNESKFVL